jgi:hypothetical protein
MLNKSLIYKENIPLCGIFVNSDHAAGREARVSDGDASRLVRLIILYITPIK